MQKTEEHSSDHKKNNFTDWIPSIPAYDFPGDELLELNKVDWKIHERDAALLVHDFQQFWLSRFESEQPLERNVHSIVSSCRSHGVPIIYSEAERPKHPAERGLAMDLWGPGIGAGRDAQRQDTYVVKSVTPKEHDYIIKKTKYSAFFGTNLEQVLRKTNRSQLIIVGVYGHHGILATALDAYMRNIKPFFVLDAIGDYSRNDHIMAASYVAEVCGVLTTTHQVTRSLAVSRE